VAGPIGACFDLGPTLVSDYRGRPGGLTATTSEVLSGLGTARSHAGLSGPIGAPRIGTFAAGEVDHRVNTNSFALQRYTYVGDTATTREFSGTLTYSLEIPDPNNAQYDIAVASGVHATLIAFTTSAEFAEADPGLVVAASEALKRAGLAFYVGASWTTDAPFRETEEAIQAARNKGILAVEMEAAALYTLARRKGVAVLCLAHVTNTMGQEEGDFEKGEADGTAEALKVLEQFEIEPFQDGYEGSPFNDFIGRLSDWEWPEV